MEHIRDLRSRAAAAGVQGVEAMSRYDLLAKLAEIETALDVLRQECASKGLPTTGNRSELELRLTEHAAGIDASDRRTYTATAYVLIGLAIAGLLISTPHITAALARLMGVNVWMAALLALVIDGGIVALKMLGNLSSKFKLGGAKLGGTVLLGVCLGFSAALNCSEFLTHADSVFSQVLAVTGALFISGFIFGTSYAGSAMLLKCEPIMKEELTASAVLLRAAAEYERLARLAENAKS